MDIEKIRTEFLIKNLKKYIPNCTNCKIFCRRNMLSKREYKHIIFEFGYGQKRKIGFDLTTRESLFTPGSSFKTFCDFYIAIKKNLIHHFKYELSTEAFIYKAIKLKLKIK